MRTDSAFWPVQNWLACCCGESFVQPPLPSWAIEVCVAPERVTVWAEARHVSEGTRAWTGPDIHEALVELERWLHTSSQGSFSVTIKAGDGRAWNAVASHWRVAAYFVLAVYEREFLGTPGQPHAATADDEPARDSAVVSRQSVQTQTGTQRIGGVDTQPIDVADGDDEYARKKA
jgi:hypothetical protein